MALPRSIRGSSSLLDKANLQPGNTTQDPVLRRQRVGTVGLTRLCRRTSLQPGSPLPRMGVINAPAGYFRRPSWLARGSATPRHADPDYLCDRRIFFCHHTGALVNPNSSQSGTAAGRAMAGGNPAPSAPKHDVVDRCPSKNQTKIISSTWLDITRMAGTISLSPWVRESVLVRLRPCHVPSVTQRWSTSEFL